MVKPKTRITLDGNKVQLRKTEEGLTLREIGLFADLDVGLRATISRAKAHQAGNKKRPPKDWDGPRLYLGDGSGKVWHSGTDDTPEGRLLARLYASLLSYAYDAELLVWSDIPETPEPNILEKLSNHLGGAVVTMPGVQDG